MTLDSFPQMIVIFVLAECIAMDWGSRVLLALVLLVIIVSTGLLSRILLLLSLGIFVLLDIIVLKGHLGFHHVQLELTNLMPVLNQLMIVFHVLLAISVTIQLWLQSADPVFQVLHVSHVQQSRLLLMV